jgi:hypothetical protein
MKITIKAKIFAFTSLTLTCMHASKHWTVQNFTSVTEAKNIEVNDEKLVDLG